MHTKIKSMKIAIFGAGGLGAFFGGILARSGHKSDHDS